MPTQSYPCTPDTRQANWIAQHAIATAAAAAVANKYGVTPRQVHDHHLDELQDLVAEARGAD